MTEAILIDAINAGGNLGIFFVGLWTLKLHGRISRLELARELEREGR